MTITRQFIPDGIPCDTKRHFDKGQPSCITIHYTGPLPNQTPTQVRKYWIDCKGEASAHFIIKDDEVLQCWPLSKVAWHAGCKAGNDTSIGIEVIPENKEGKFSEQSIATLKELLETLPKLPIVRHYDWTGKACPAYYTQKDRWVSLLDKISKS